ncbi:MAG: ribonuclease III [Clostridia bacterium]|nr:ribonuclease III [Clostridia bacterium]
MPRALSALLPEPPRNLELYRLAFTHASYAHELGLPERPGRSYERLEFLGDAVIQLAVSELLAELRPDAPEGDLTRWRAAIVKAAALAEVSERLGLGDLAVLGPGEEAAGGRRRRKLLADLLEALVGAIHLDLGWEAARGFVRRHLGPLAEEAPALPPENARGLLQEHLQAQGKSDIRYEVVSVEGPPHRRRFTVEVLVEGRALGRGEGRSKKEAARRAAEEALLRIRA